jgi:hypothetical protein
VSQGPQRAPASSGSHVVVVALAAITMGCSLSPEPPALRMTQPDGSPAFVHVVNLPADVLADMGGRARTADQWAAILKVSTTADGPPIVGDYRVVDGTLRFTPTYPFDPGRPYAVQFNGSAAGYTGGLLFGTLALPGDGRTRSTTVTAIYPSGDTVPENLLRIYIHFSAPMGRSGGVDQVEWLDATGAVVEGAFLPLDYEFFDATRTRFTLFLDPGRVKRGILPNRQSGRALKNGERYTLLVKSSWRDENGQPLQAEFRKHYTAGPAAMHGLDTAQWKVGAGRRPGPSGPIDEIIAGFPAPLDRGLTLRALSVRRNGQEVPGEARTDRGETQWIFAPSQPLSPGNYELIALSILEDPAGNQIGKAFEIDNFEAVDKSPDPQTVALPFLVRGP